MKKKHIKQTICGLILISTLCCCSNGQKVPEEQNTDDSVVTVENDGIAALTNSIERNLPFNIPFSTEELKSINWDDVGEELELYLYIDERVGEDWWGDDTDDDQYWGKYFIAEIFNLVNIEHNINQLEQDEQEDIKSDERWKTVVGNRNVFKNLHNLLQDMVDEGYGAKIKLRSRDGMDKIILLTADEVKDAVVFSREILDKVNRDHTVDAF